MKVTQLSCLSLVALLVGAASAVAGPGHWSIGVRIGGPPVVVAPRPHYHYHYPYYRYSYVRPVWYEPAPVIVRPAPVYVEQPAVAAPAPAFVPPAPRVVASTPIVDSAKAAGIAALREQLRQPDEKTRSDAALELGRLKAEGAVDPLAATLAGDPSPLVRDAAARALGLIGSPRALTALTYAAQADSDRDVRRSAQFAVDVIQTNSK